MEISLRQYRPSDAPAFHEAVIESVEHVSRWLPWCHAEYSLTEAEEWADSAARVWEEGTEYRLLIEDVDSRRILGSVGINIIEPRHRIGSLGYWVRKSALNQGVCTRAARQAVEFAFNTLGLHRIEIHCLVDNHASNAVARKIGGVYEGTFRNKILFHDTPMPAKCYSIIPSDYAENAD